jgi:hypothetical protein
MAWLRRIGDAAGLDQITPLADACLKQLNLRPVLTG